MTDGIEKVEQFKTPDGEVHATLLRAEYWLARCAVQRILFDAGFRTGDSDWVLNTLADNRHRRALREWLDACDRIEADTAAAGRAQS